MPATQAYATPPPEPSDEPAVAWDHASFVEDSHFGREVAAPAEFLRSLEVEGYAVRTCPRHVCLFSALLRGPWSKQSAAPAG
jgi:hypothetical protein